MNPENVVRTVRVAEGLKMWALTEQDFLDMKRTLNKSGCIIRTNKEQRSIYIVSTPYDKPDGSILRIL